MVKTLKITPLDPLFFRSPMPFTSGEQDWAPASGLPTPSTLYGAIRSMILSRRNFEKFLTEGYADIGNPNKKGTLKLKTFFIAQENGKYYFPAPANVLVETEKKSQEKVKRIALSSPSDLPMVVTSPVSYKLEKFFYTQEDGLEIKPIWLSNEKLKKYLDGDIQSSSSTSKSGRDFLFQSEIFLPEPKTGIERDENTKASKTNKLYRVEHHRYKDGISLVAIVEGTDEDLNGIFTLGGERRTAKIEEVSGNPLEIFTPTVSKRFVVYLMTPAIFVSSWYPERILNNLRGEGIEVELISAVIPNYKVISGWDIQKMGPKPLYRAVPEGSVFVFEVMKGSIAKAIDSFHGKNISEINPEEGYGFALAGMERKED